MTIRYKFAISILLLCISSVTQAVLQVTVDRNKVSIQESFQLHIVSDKGNPGDIDLSAIRLFFDIVSSSSSSSINFTNGKISSKKTLQLTLIAKRKGEILIPSLELAGERSQPIRIQVQAGGGQTPADNRLATVELSADSRSARVQQQIVLTVKLFYQGQRFHDGRLDTVVHQGSIIQFLGEQTYQTQTNGIRWQVLERKYAFFPQQSGVIEIPPVRFQGTVKASGQRNNFFFQGKAFSARSKPLQLDVLPAAYTDAAWLPARNLTATSTVDKNTVRAGEALTRSITLRARGQLGEQIPPFETPNITGVQIYQDKSDASNQTSLNGVDGIRTETQIVIPQDAGAITIPDQQISWWDVRSNSRQSVIVPGHLVEVLPAVASASAPTYTDAVSSSETFSWIEIVLLILLPISMALNVLLWRRKPIVADRQVADDEGTAFHTLSKQLQRATTDDFLSLVNQWFEQLSIRHCVSVRQVVSLLATHVREDEQQKLEQLHRDLEKWLYHQDKKPDLDFFFALCHRLRTEYGFPNTFSVPGFSLEKNQ